MDLEKLNLIKQSILQEELIAKPYSEEFCGVVVHSNSPFKFSDWQSPIHSFRVYSEYKYPIIVFISSESITDDFVKLINLYDNIQVQIIPTLKSIIEFNEFEINSLLFLLPKKYLNLAYIQPDGMIIKRGWEDKIQGHSFLGAKWKDPIQVIETTFHFPAVSIGNGGAGFRRRDKCIEVLKLLDKYGKQNNIVKGIQINGKIRNKGSFLAEDLLFNYFGRGGGIFEPEPLDMIDSFALEPITLEQFNNKQCHFFHRID